MQQQVEEAVEEQAALADYLAKEPIANMDLHRLDAFHPPAPVQAKHQVPGYSTVIDPFELHLVGRGLPIIQGAAWPEAFQQPLKELAAGRKVAVPRPHPKFSMQDMERIATQGPVFSDIMLRHVERDSPESASAYNYVPSTVLGDWTYEVEPNWVNLPQ
ncbi:AAA domain-containing protein, partial [Haematococcus lacustris]